MAAIMKEEKKSRKFRLGFSCSLMLIIMLACRPDLRIYGINPTSTAIPVVSLSELQFDDSETGQRFYALDRCIVDITDDSWKQIPYYIGGNFYKSRWCKGAGVRSDCQFTEATSDNRDQDIFRLYTMFYPQNYPEVFGLGFHYQSIPVSTGWGVNFSYDEKGGSIVGSGWQVQFYKYSEPTGSPEISIYLGSVYGYTIYGSPTSFRIETDLPLQEDLAFYLSGSEQMRDRALAQNQSLKTEVISAIKAHQINTCDLGPYLDDGLPPLCTQRLLTPEEEMEELAKAEVYFAEREEILHLYHQELYRVWMNSFPFNECWP
jgi:hypothetical protein